jgi:C4-dicarboxylate-specific signal transduction histidine kinase
MKPVAVQRDLAENLPQIEANGPQLEQVLVNLVRNALDAMAGRPDGKLSISTGTATLEALLAQEQEAGWRTCLAIEPEEQDRRASWAYIEVRDNGMGIATPELEDIFEPFHTTKEEGKGTGLGLTISRSILRDHRGTLLVASRVGAGTSFRILLRPASGG